MNLQWIKKILTGTDALSSRAAGASVAVAFDISTPAAEWHNRGVSEQNRREYVAAIQCYDEALKIDSSRAITWHNKGVVLEELRRRDEALLAFDQAILHDTRQQPSWEAKARLLARSADTRTETFCDAAASQFPSSSYFECMKALSMQVGGRSHDAARVLDRLIARNPTDGLPLFFRGNISRELGDFHRAATFFRAAVERDSSLFEAWTNLGVCLTDQGRIAEALVCHEKSVAMSPGNAIGWSNVAHCRLVLGQTEGALEAYERALSVDSMNPDTWFDKGTVLNEMGRAKAAIGAYERAVSLDPRHWKAWNNKGRSEDAIGEVGDAMKSYRAFLAAASTVDDPALNEHREHSHRRIDELKEGMVLCGYNYRCKHVLFILKYCSSYEDAGPFFRTMRQRRVCDTCGGPLNDVLGLMVMASAEARESCADDPDAIDVRQTAKGRSTLEQVEVETC